MFNQAVAKLGRVVCSGALAVATVLPAGAAPILSIDPTTVNVSVGQTFTIDVRIGGAVDLYAFQFDLGFDPTLLSASSVTEGAFLSAGGPTLFVDGSIDNSLGIVSSTANVLNGALDGVDGDGVLASLTFKVLAAGTGSISLFNEILLDSALADIALTNISGAQVTATQSANVAEPPVLALVGAAWLSLLLFGKRRACA